MQSALIDVVERLKLEDEKMREFLGWVADIDQRLTLTEVKDTVKEKMLAPLDPTSRNVFVAMFVALGRLEQGV